MGKEGYGLATLELVRDARQKRYMTASQKRIKTGQPPESAGCNWQSESGVHPARHVPEEPQQRSGHSRPLTAPVEPRLADTLARCLTQQCTPPAGVLPYSHAKTCSKASKASHTACTAHKCGLPQWHVHSKANLLDMSTHEAVPLAYGSSHTRQAKVVANIWPTRQPSQEQASVCNKHTVEAALAPAKQLLDQQMQDHEASMYCSIEQARETRSLEVSSHNLSQLPPQMMRFLIAEGRNICRLDVSHNQLLISPPWELLTSVQHVDVSHNRLENLGSTVQLLKQLTQLHVQHNSLVSLPHALGTLTCLTHLNTSHNKLEMLPASTSALVCLQTLEASYNQLQALPSGLGCFQRLQTLAATHNQLTGLPHSISQCCSLCDLRVNDNLLSAVPTSIGGLFSSLQSLQLHNNNLTVLPREVAMLTAITHLTLDDNPLHIPPPEVTQGGIQAVRIYLSTYTCTQGIRITMAGDGKASGPIEGMYEALEEQGEQLLHLQAERDKLQHNNLALLGQLKHTQKQLAASEQETSELIRQAQSAGKDDADALPSDVIELGRMVHQLRIELRKSQSITDEHKRRADAAEDALQAERKRRLQAEEAAAVVKPEVQLLHSLQQKVQAGEKRAEDLEELVANHLFQQCAAEQRCWEAEAKLDMLELGKLSAWMQEVQKLRSQLHTALHSKQDVEMKAAQAKRDLMATLAVLQRQLNALQDERECIWQADKLVQRVQQR